MRLPHSHPCATLDPSFLRGAAVSPWMWGVLGCRVSYGALSSGSSTEG